ncbi:MAG: helix-turn-helix domain-containing protein [Candidatus Hodarchaeales archaeon]
MKDSSDQNDKAAFVNDVMAAFRSANYVLSDHSIRTAAFDFFARKEENLIITKTCTNLDSFKQKHGLELRLISEIVTASPLLVANRDLRDDAIYSRYGIPGLNFPTLKRILHGDRLPQIISKRGGFYHRIKGEVIPEDELLVEELAEKCGVTSKTLYYWKKGKSLPTPDRLRKLARALNKDHKDLIRDINPFDEFQSLDKRISESSEQHFRPRGSLQNEIDELLREINMKASWLHSAPFDAICTESSQKKTRIVPLVTGAGVDSRDSRRRLEITSSILKLVNNRGLWISESDQSSEFRIDIPVLSLAELERIKKPKELERTIQRKKRKHVSKENGSSNK